MAALYKVGRLEEVDAPLELDILKKVDAARADRKLEEELGGGRGSGQ